MKKSLASTLKNPGKTFRGAPFWAWNAKLSPAELRRQIRIMKQMGLGGFFMHSRVGLNTEYLGKDWFACVKACTDEAQKLGMDAWLYDEDRWPSGAAGGKVTKVFPEHRMRRLLMKDCTDGADIEPDGAPVTLAWFAVAGKTDKNAIASYRRLAGPDAPLAKGETLLRFYDRADAPSSWYNDGTYLDTLSTEAVDKFIEITHEAYLAQCGEDFGKTIPGIFTDEPNYGGLRPWTRSFADAFRAMHGYDVLDHLPELFFKVGDEAFSKVRLNFTDTATQLFVDAFGKRIGDWCGRHGLEYTGHLLDEDSLAAQTDVVGETMRFYEHMQAPGIDLLTEHWTIYRTAKQCTSMARQFGRRRRLSETNGCTGWDFPLEGHKALGDWQVALGINLRCQHLAWYSMEAAAKRDYPASIFRQSPWHGVYGAVEDYFARIGEVVFAEGFEEVRDLLVLHPIESAWGVKITRDAAPTHETDHAFLTLSSALLGANIDFDYGSEAVLSRHARIKGGKFVVAKAAYKAVVVPPMLTIRASTLKLLADFAAAGGTVCYVGKPPSRVDGASSRAAAKAFKAFTPCTNDNVAASVESVARRVSIAQDGVETEATLHLLSERKDALSIFVCNTSMPMPTPADEMNAPFVRDRVLEYPDAVLKIKSRARGDVYEVDAMTGAVHRVDFTHEKGAYVIPCPLGRLETRLFVIAKEKPGRTQAPRRRRAAFTQHQPLPAAALPYKLSEPNVMVLDHASYAVDGAAAGEDKFILAIDKELRAALGADPRSGRMVQPWVAGERKPEKDLAISLTYAFTCKNVPAKPVMLAIERPDIYTITLNGKEVKPQDKGFWMDPAIRRLSLPRFKKGENTLVLSGRYHIHLPGLEAIYLLGDFGVRNERVLCAPSATLDIGDWVAQGLENYAGNVTYTFKIGRRPGTKRRVFLRMPSWRGAALGVSVNGGAETLLPWPPYEIDVTDALRETRNAVKVTVYGHRRNACGPFYLKDQKWPSWTGPGEMDRHDVRERGLVPCGLLEPVELAW
ncbi:MAG: glycosyl hydrolase [Kiritimatiellia bacterium]